MTAGKPTRSTDRLERFVRSMLGAALIAAVVWALMGNSTGMLTGGL